MSAALKLLPEVAVALQEGRPVVALESTLLAHGLPQARRAEVAALLEDEVRAGGAVPATIAVIDKQLCVGLEPAQRARIIGGGVMKASVRDLPRALTLGGVWATTVAATMAIAAKAGIRLFATGGIGGVHRGAEKSYDESADLVALARYPVAVVSAGAKAVLDLPRTLERLETLGVPVVGVHTDELPAFYSRHSGVPLPDGPLQPDQVARLLHARFSLLGDGGVLVVQPPPAAAAADGEPVHQMIEEALAEAKDKKIRGRAVTPFLLGWLAERSAGSLVETNIALVQSNAQLAAQVACAYARLSRAADLH